MNKSKMAPIISALALSLSISAQAEAASKRKNPSPPQSQQNDEIKHDHWWTQYKAKIDALPVVTIRRYFKTSLQKAWAPALPSSAIIYTRSRLWACFYPLWAFLPLYCSSFGLLPWLLLPKRPQRSGLMMIIAVLWGKWFKLFVWNIISTPTWWNLIF